MVRYIYPVYFTLELLNSLQDQIKHEWRSLSWVVGELGPPGPMVMKDLQLF